MMTSYLMGLSLTVGQLGHAPMTAEPVPADVPTQALINRIAAAPPGTPDPVAPKPDPMPPAKNGDADKKNGDADKNGSNGNGDKDAPTGGFFHTLYKEYHDAFFPPKDAKEPEPEPEKPRRAPPAPWGPPLPVAEYQGYPLIGVPPGNEVWPLQKALTTIPCVDDFQKWSKINMYGWVTGSGNFSTAKQSNSPTSYWLVPNRMELDQAVVRFEREADTVQTDHIDFGFRSSFLYGIDYRYMTAGGYFSDQLLKHNRLNGFDPTEQYVDMYIPNVAQGLIFRLGRWIACPDIETQFSPDNYLGSHSILFTYDTYTQSGFMVTLKLSDMWMVQAGLNAGNDMAPWYRGAVPCGYAAVRWTSKDNNDGVYLVLNQINNAEFQHFDVSGQPAGHDNFNYVVGTYEHRFSQTAFTKTEAYYMWQYDAELGGTPSLGPPQYFAPATGSDGTLLPGLSRTYGVLNYTCVGITKDDYITVRNEWWKDERGMRSGTPGVYTSHTIGLSHNFNKLFQVRPEIGYYRNWTNDAFDNGNTKGIWMVGFDTTLRF